MRFFILRQNSSYVLPEGGEGDTLVDLIFLNTSRRKM